MTTSSARGAPLWQLHLAAAPAVARDGVRWPLGRRDAALLAWLAIEGPTPRARLAELLWPDKDGEAARNSLRQRLFQLRKGIGIELVAGSTTLALAEGLGHDLEDSDSVLAGSEVDIGGEFAGWLAQQRERRRARTQTALAELAQMAEDARDYADALSHARELLALEPLSEEAHRRVMRLHYLAGDRAAALLAFDRCERVLKDEVGTRPSAPTRALLETIERAQPGAALRPAPVVPAALQRPPRLIARATELTALERACTHDGFVLLFGEAGIGKTRLLGALGNEGAAASARMWVTARPGDASVPYALAAKLLRALLQRDGVQAGTERQDLAIVLPELGAAALVEREQVRARLAAAASALVARAVASGLRAMVVDDLHFADDASVELLAPLIGNRSCAWVLAMRPGEFGAAAQSLVSAHADERDTVRLQLQPLGTVAIAELIDSLGLDGISGAGVAEAMHRRTGGNPLYVLETIKAASEDPRDELVLQGEAVSALRWPLADNVRRMIQHRLTRLSPLAMKVARCAAVAGQDLSSMLVAEVLGLHPLDLADAWTELESAQILRDAAFAHDLIADAAMASVPDAVARPLHAQVAAFLERAQGEAARVAEHWRAAGEPLKAVPHWNRAAQAAAKAWQNLEAARLFGLAASALADAGDRRGAFDAHYFAATALSEETVDDRLLPLIEAMENLAADDGQRAMAALYRIAWLAESRRIDEALPLAQQASDWAARAGLQDVEVELLWDLTALHWEKRELTQAIQRVEQTLSRSADVKRDVVRVQLERTRDKALHASGVLYAAVGRYALAAERYEQSLLSARRSGDRTRMLSCANSLAACAEDQGDLVRALRWSAQAVEGADKGEANQFAATFCSRRLGQLAASGDLGGALQMAELTSRLCAKGYQRSLVYDMVRVGLLYHELGRRDLALQTLHALRGRSDLQPVESNLIDAACAFAGERVDRAALLGAIADSEDLSMRVRLLTLGACACEPAAVLPYLTMTLAFTQDHGAHGFWLNLQARRVAALRAVGRLPESAQAALSVWGRIEQGIAGSEPFPRVAAELRAALQATHVNLADVIGLRASAWVQRAASTLPPAWRDNYLYRSPSLQAGSPGAPALPSG